MGYDSFHQTKVGKLNTNHETLELRLLAPWGLIVPLQDGKNNELDVSLKNV